MASIFPATAARRASGRRIVLDGRRLARILVAFAAFGASCGRESPTSSPAVSGHVPSAPEHASSSPDQAPSAPDQASVPARSAETALAEKPLTASDPASSASPATTNEPAPTPDSSAAAKPAATEPPIAIGLEVGHRAPDFEAKDIEGVAFKLSDYRGKVVVLDFWGFW
jgi:hypothetical protein